MAILVTIVVLLILAGITITYVMGDNSVFRQASDAKLKTDIAKWQERLETAKAPNIIEGLGKFNPDKYFEYIESQGIIEDKEREVIDNEDGTYDVTTKPGYVFEVELIPNQGNPTDAKIEYLGQVENLPPKIKGIRIVEATKASFKVKISARLAGGIVECYYKAKESVAASEIAEDVTGYTQITLDSNLEGSVTNGLIAGTTYKVKALIKKDGKIVGTSSKEVTTTVMVTNITLNQTTAKVAPGKSITLIATIEPTNAEHKELEWKSSNENIATVDQNGKVTGVVEGKTEIIATAKDGSEVNGKCTVTVEIPESDWEKIAEVAKLIAEDSTINNRTKQVTKDNMTIKVGDLFQAKYDGYVADFRVLGFNHDLLANPEEAYGVGTSATRAGITFSLVQRGDKPRISKEMIKLNNQTVQDWSASNLRTFCQIQLRDSLSENCKRHIKGVRKPYTTFARNYADVVFGGYVEDLAWVPSLAEVVSGEEWKKLFGELERDGEQYQYFTEDFSQKVFSTSGGWLRTRAKNERNLRQFFCLWSDRVQTRTEYESDGVIFSFSI